MSNDYAQKLRTMLIYSKILDYALTLLYLGETTSSTYGAQQALKTLPWKVLEWVKPLPADDLTLLSAMTFSLRKTKSLKCNVTPFGYGLLQLFPQYLSQMDDLLSLALGRTSWTSTAPPPTNALDAPDSST